MNNSEQLFRNIEGSETFAYLEYDEREGCHKFVTQTYDQITSVIEELEGVSKSELGIIRGMVLERDESQYTTLELGSFKDGELSYVFFKSKTKQGMTAILAKITERLLNPYEKIFIGKEKDSRGSTILEDNEVISNGFLVTSEYLEICDGEDWYTYADREKGVSLTVPNIKSKEDLVLVDTKG
jgi:hypothetical protein